MKRLIVFVLLTSASAPACAGGSATDVTVADIYFGELGKVVFIRVNPAPGGAPACATHPFYNFTINLTSPGASQLYAAVLSAMMSGKLVSIAGSGACNNSPVVEDLSNFVLTQ